jgi:hypothetical protein
VAGVRFRNTLRDARDAVFIFLAIGVGLAAGVQAMTVAFLLSAIFNFVLLLIWRYDFGRNVLEPTASGQWAGPLSELADSNGGTVPDRDLVLALSPKKVKALQERFARVHQILGSDRKKPRFNAVLSLTTNNITDAQARTEAVLADMTKRWKLDEVITNEGKPSELYYLVKVRKSTSREDLLTALRADAGESLLNADLETGEDLTVDE